MKKLKLFLLLFTFNFTLGFSQTWQWGEAGNGPLKAIDYASSVATDKNGNVYITGQYEPTIIFGSDTLTDFSDNAYLTKYNSSGTVIWAKQLIDVSGNSFGYSVATDKPGNIYMAGYFTVNAKAGTFSLNGNGPNTAYVFLIKYNSNGTVLWAKQNTVPSNSSIGSAQANSVATDKMGNVFIAGMFYDTVSFGNFTLKSAIPGPLAFLVKYDLNGNVLWAKQSVAGGDPHNYYGTAANSVTADKYGNAYITGCFYDTVSFGATTLYDISGGSPNAFLVKYSPSGSAIWAKQSVSSSLSSLSISNAVITDGDGDPYITGYFQDIVKFGAQAIYSPSANSTFLTKYDTSGNAIWARQSSPGWEGDGLSSDENNYIYMAGTSYFKNPDSLRFNYYVLPTNPWAFSSAFLMKFDTTGRPVCGSILNNLGFYRVNGIASDSTGTYIYTTSTFFDTVICGPDTLIAQGGGDNTFVGRWLNCNAADGIPTITTKSGSINVYPNPSNGIFTMQSSVASGHPDSYRESVEVYNMLGEKVYTLTLPSTNGEGASVVSQLNLSSQPDGIYLVRVTNGDGSISLEKKIIKTK